jgi:2-oxoglutarate ferredoxin oxidoreductase subunit delta
VAQRFWRPPLQPPPPTAAPGVVHIIDDRCKGCGFCIEFCPRGVLSESEGYNKRGYHPPVVTFNEHCVECRLCEFICPEFAIYVTPGETCDA